MNLHKMLSTQGLESRRFEYDDRTEFVVDFGTGFDVALDIVDDVAIIVVGDDQYEVGLDGNERVFMNNGVLTFEVRE